ncbi:MAG: hypothetical protein JXA30_11615 [Deltaproteobacteria bacterium]|nr:hypothetical protein [Deltaproteobacteria bacterium]
MNRKRQNPLNIKTKRESFFGCRNWIDPRLDSWTRGNAVLAHLFSADLAGGNKSAMLYFGFVVQITGDYIWNREQPEPGWAKLDVEGFQREILNNRLKLDDISTGNFNISLEAFYTFLVNRGYLEIGPGRRIIEQLQRYDNTYVKEMLKFAEGPARTPQDYFRGTYELQRLTVAYAKGISRSRSSSPLTEAKTRCARERQERESKPDYTGNYASARRAAENGDSGYPSIAV